VWSLVLLLVRWWFRFSFHFFLSHHWAVSLEFGWAVHLLLFPRIDFFSSILIHSRELFRALVIFFSSLFFPVQVIPYLWCDCIIISFFHSSLVSCRWLPFFFSFSFFPFSFLSHDIIALHFMYYYYAPYFPLPTNFLHITTGGNYINDGTIYAVNGIGEGG